VIKLHNIESDAAVKTILNLEETGKNQTGDITCQHTDSWQCAAHEM